eukprot:SAG31_NODE_11430_length_1031_cov_1.797210_1_plen_38_part_10
MTHFGLPSGPEKSAANGARATILGEALGQKNQKKKEGG